MDEVLLEQLIIYGAVFLLRTVIIVFYLRKKKVKSVKTEQKVEVAKEDGAFRTCFLISAYRSRRLYW